MARADLTPIDRKTAADACTTALRDRILAGAFAPGSTLPPERRLALDFGVNRVTVRAALGTLAAEGMLKIRQGSGAHVADFLESGGPGLISKWISLARGDAAHDAVADLLAVRRALARVVVERLVARIDDAGRGRIAAAVQAFARTLDETRDARAIALADLDVMKSIVAETRSPVLQLCLNPIAAVLTGLPQLCAAMFAEPELSLFGYERFVGELERPRAALADELVAMLDLHDNTTLARLEHQQRRKRP